eukprot:CFRG4175T1
MSSTFRLYYLHDRNDLFQEAAELLNTAWPRSYSARQATFKRSKNTLPCMYVLLRSQSPNGIDMDVKTVSTQASIDIKANESITLGSPAAPSVNTRNETTYNVCTLCEGECSHACKSDTKSSTHNALAPVREICTITVDTSKNGYHEVTRNVVIGFAQVCFPHKPRNVIVQSVVIHPSLQGLGLGKALLLSIENDVKIRLKIVRIHLSTTDKVEFYKRCGYRVVGNQMYNSSHDEAHSDAEKGNQMPELAEDESRDSSINIPHMQVQSPSLQLPAPVAPRMPPPGPPPPPPPPPPKGAVSDFVKPMWLCKRL